MIISLKAFLRNEKMLLGIIIVLRGLLGFVIQRETKP